MLLAGAKSVLIWCFSFKMVLLAGDTKPFLNFDWAYEHKIQQHRSQLHATTQAECSNCSGSTCEDSDTECILHYSALFYTILNSFDLNISERQIPEDKLKLKAGESVGTLASTMMGDA